MNQSCFLFFILLPNFPKEKRKKYPQIYLRRDGGNVFSCQLLYNGVEKEFEARLDFLLVFFFFLYFFIFLEGRFSFRLPVCSWEDSLHMLVMTT